MEVAGRVWHDSGQAGYVSILKNYQSRHIQLVEIGNDPECFYDCIDCRSKACNGEKTDQSSGKRSEGNSMHKELNGVTNCSL